MLLHRRSDTGKWALIGGALDPGEHPADGVVREVLEETGIDAATGQIELNGTVTPIGGVKQKIFGVRQADADVFLVPAGDNARVARRYASGVRVIPVKSFPQALQALATLPPKG